MRYSVVISDKKWNSFGVILDNICLAAAAAGLCGVVYASRGHHPPLQAEPSGRVISVWESTFFLGFSSALQQRVGVSSPGYGGWRNWVAGMCSLQFFIVTGCLVTRYDAQVNLMPEVSWLRLLMNLTQKFKNVFLSFGSKKTTPFSLIWYTCVLDSPQNCGWVLGIILVVLIGNRILSSWNHPYQRHHLFTRNSTTDSAWGRSRFQQQCVPKIKFRIVPHNPAVASLIYPASNSVSSGRAARDPVHLHTLSHTAL